MSASRKKAGLPEVLGMNTVTREFGGVTYTLSPPQMKDYALWANREKNKLSESRRDKAKRAVADLKEVGIQDEEVLRDTYISIINGKDEEGMSTRESVMRLLGAGFTSLDGARFWFWRMAFPNHPEVTEAKAGDIITDANGPEVFEAMAELRPPVPPKKSTGGPDEKKEEA